MGSGESTTRKVSFGVDDEDRVRILRGVKLSEDVLQRMRGVANIAPKATPAAPVSQKDTGASQSTSSNSKPQQSPQHRAQPSTQSNTSKSASKEEQKRYERQQKVLKEELAQQARSEREAAKEDKLQALSRERQHTRQEAEKAKQLSADEIKLMAQQLHKKDLRLKALEAFYKEQLAQMDQRDMERYEQSKEQFHQAATEKEANIRSRNTDPVCLGLQAQILSCYRENKNQTLKCSDLAKDYMHCINAAKKAHTEATVMCFDQCHSGSVYNPAYHRHRPAALLLPVSACAPLLFLELTSIFLSVYTTVFDRTAHQVKSGASVSSSIVLVALGGPQTPQSFQNELRVTDVETWKGVGGGAHNCLLRETFAASFCTPGAP
ncbi:uncharacterized protein V6R79_016234 [Siganus canaliculatus]